MDQNRRDEHVVQIAFAPNRDAFRANFPFLRSYAGRHDLQHVAHFRHNLRFDNGILYFRMEKNCRFAAIRKRRDMSLMY